MKNFYVLIVLLILNSSLNAQWIKTDFIDSNILLSTDFTGDNGIVSGWHLPEFLANAYYTSDLGTTWHTASTPDSLRVIVDFQIINASLVYGCGAKNKIIYNRNVTDLDLKELLSERTRHPFLKQGILSAPDNEEYRGQFLQSTNLGHSWQYKGSLPDTVTYLINLQFLNQNIGYVLAVNDNSSGLLKTTDGGNTWNWSFQAGLEANLAAFEFVDSLNGYIVGSVANEGGLFVKTIDGGTTWTSSVLNNVIEVSHVKCISPSVVLVSGWDANFGQNLLISTDNGSSWNLAYYIENGQIDGINGFPGGWSIFYGTYYPTGSSTPFVNGTTNLGQTWVDSTLSPLTDIVMAGSKMIDNERWYITGSHMFNYGFLLSTFNSGGLPVELISFTAAQSGKFVRLDWITGSEINNRGFEIQSKSFGDDFRKAGFVKGNGTTTEKQMYSFIDRPESATEKIIYRLKQLDYNGNISYSDEISVDFAAPGFSLQQNYPNPFNPTTTISYSIKGDALVILKVFNLLGQEIVTLVNEAKPAGSYEVDFAASNLPSGIYFYSLTAGSFVKTMQMLLLK